LSACACVFVRCCCFYNRFTITVSDDHRSHYIVLHTYENSFDHYDYYSPISTLRDCCLLFVDACDTVSVTSFLSDYFFTRITFVCAFFMFLSYRLNHALRNRRQLRLIWLWLLNMVSCNVFCIFENYMCVFLCGVKFEVHKPLCVGCCL